MTPEILRIRFESGVDFDTFKAGAENNKQVYSDLYDTLRVPQTTVTAFAEQVQRHGGQLNVLALAEDWCGDAARAFPLLARLSEAVAGMSLRILQSELESNQPLTRRWPKGERNPIPIVVFFDHNFNELGHWIERTQAGNVVLEQLREEHKELEGSAFFQVAGPKMLQAFKDTLWQDTLTEWQDVLAGKPQSQ